MTLSQARIAIIGAGPAGLTLARLLELAKIAYVVFERDESAALAGEYSSSGTLDIHEKLGQSALKEAGLLDKFQSIARYDVPTRIVDAQGKVIVMIPGESNTHKPEIARKDLRNLLLSSIPDKAIRWGCKVEDVQKDNDGSVSIHLTNGQVVSGFLLVVGADGAWSKVRKLITSEKPQYSGTHFFTTFIKPEDPTYTSVASVVETGNYLAMGNGRQIFLHYLGDRSYHLSVGLKLPENWTSSSMMFHDSSALWKSLLQNEFIEWTQELTKLISSSNRSFRSWPLYSTPEKSVDWKHIPGVTLIGDAAHLTVPTGEGVNNALYDSAELARQIIKCGIDDLDSAVIIYEKEMLPRALKAIGKGKWYTEHFFGADTPQSFLQASMKS
ncbi:hypothetical protein INT43_005814 [Umbelopsis isabellina]|uniref:FAD-binding domain-containing protein n=1 Tax=Mortierella isabellina TaxID=91625 RepID=A0A8H7U7T2_MORIS|nr:hypothetical protein INT43_005814 [Umbelopsis isabellina]